MCIVEELGGRGVEQGQYRGGVPKASVDLDPANYSDRWGNGY